MARQGYMFRLTIIIMIALLVIAYTVFNTRLIFRGPTVQFYNLQNGQVIEGDGLIEIKGEAQNVSYISLNGRQIFMDEKSHQFNEKVLLTSKINSFEVFVSDKFGKEDHKKITLVYKDAKQIEIPKQVEATSTQEEPADNT
jgi:hypothetical protein